ncbi:growth arrest-specific protein 1-like isoform X1 [Penaeus chinensis]|uniref:growth arrest-specific protein 1-like isoform X1 n=2 Tax=Penaeus chinensis TaxID=139456 RepID=UPI001FB6D157|nr:growth arrest-specific protein 1-like isoform X1 [Penaeus chinensis]
MKLTGMWRVAWTTLFATLIGVGGAGPGTEGHPEGPGTAHPSYLNASEDTTSVNRSSKPDSSSRASAASMRTCAEAKIRCALRSGCGMALQNYMLGCADLMSGRIDYCDEYCKNALIALTSTEEGHDLMDCACGNAYCRETKARIEVCREEVLAANADTTVVSCNVAHWICAADTSCSTAISYYDSLCRRMFIGKGCSYRCNNSISILQRQEKAAKLETCVCDGTEPFDCEGIKRNMARLCFHEFDEEEMEKEEEETNEVDTTSVSKARLNSSAGIHSDGHVLWLTTVAYALSASVVRWGGAGS